MKQQNPCHILTTYHVEEIEHVDGDTFERLITFPTIMTVSNDILGLTRIIRRDSTSETINLPTDDSSWASTVHEDDASLDSGVTLGDVCERISCGVATGADSVFIVDEDEIAPQLKND